MMCEHCLQETEEILLAREEILRAEIEAEIQKEQQLDDYSYQHYWEY